MSWDILGHEWAVDLLSEHVAQGRVRHAYLFTGPQGLGRRTLALSLAQALNCPKPLAPGQPCQKCSTCRRIRQMTHPDLSVVQAEQVGGTLKVEQVRELQRSLALSPYEAAYRVAVLLRFEEAHTSAANALLKTLEEPNPQVVLVLTANSPEDLLPTIVSRCEGLRLRPLTIQQVAQGLQARQQHTQENANLLAHLSDGRPGYAFQLQAQPELLELRQTWLEDLYRLISANRVERFAYAQVLTKDKEKEAVRSVLYVWLSFWRDVLLKAGGASASVTNIDWIEQINSLAASLNLASAQKVVASLEHTLGLMDGNINTRLAIEVLLLDLPRAHTL